MFSESLRLVRADNGRMFELASEWFAELRTSRRNRRVGRYTDRILVLQPVSGKVYSFSGIKKSGTAEISGLSSLNEGDEGLFLLLIAHSNHAYKRTKDKIKQKTHAEF